MREYTPEFITCTEDLPDNAIFFFGSNTEGRHGKGAALIALKYFGAVYGKAKGKQGRSYAIITKDLSKGIRSVSLDYIYNQLVDAVIYALISPNEKCYFTKLGSSLAGFKIEEIKNLFTEIHNLTGLPDNVILPFDYEMRN